MELSPSFSPAGWQASDKDIQTRAAGLSRLIAEHRWLAVSHVTDFFVRDLWSKVPPEWREILERLSPKDAVRIVSLVRDPTLLCAALQRALSTPEDLAPALPESLHRFLEDVASLPLPRNPGPVASEGEEPSRKRAGAGLARGMTPKKLHEVERLAALAATILRDRSGAGEEARTADTYTSSRTVVVDVGSGQGYLTRLLAWEHGLDAIGVEGDAGNVRAAEEADARVWEELQFRKFGKGARSASKETQCVGRRLNDPAGSGCGGEGGHGWIRHVHARVLIAPSPLRVFRMTLTILVEEVVSRVSSR